MIKIHKTEPHQDWWKTKLLLFSIIMPFVIFMARWIIAVIFGWFAEAFNLLMPLFTLQIHVIFQTILAKVYRAQYESVSSNWQQIKPPIKIDYDDTNRIISRRLARFIALFGPYCRHQLLPGMFIFIKMCVHWIIVGLIWFFWLSFVLFSLESCMLTCGITLPINQSMGNWKTVEPAMLGFIINAAKNLPEPVAGLIKNAPGFVSVTLPSTDFFTRYRFLTACYLYGFPQILARVVCWRAFGLKFP